MLRRLVALLALVLMVGSIAEPALGVLRDGAVHHETTASAAVHAGQSAGDHGHEESPPFDHQHGRHHQHGTGADHCTHQHGLALLTDAPLPLNVVPSAENALVAEYLAPIGRHPLDLFHPPRV